MRIVFDKETEDFFEALIMKCLEKHSANRSALLPERIYTINSIAKRLRVSHSTIKARIQSGMIKTTKDGRITENELNNFLHNI